MLAPSFGWVSRHVLSEFYLIFVPAPKGGCWSRDIFVALQGIFLLQTRAAMVVLTGFFERAAGCDVRAEIPVAKSHLYLLIYGAGCGLRALVKLYVKYLSYNITY